MNSDSSSNRCLVVRPTGAQMVFAVREDLPDSRQDPDLVLPIPGQMSEGFLERALDVAEAVQGEWIAVVVGERLEELSRCMPAPVSLRSLMAWLSLVRDFRLEGDAWSRTLVRGLARVIRQARMREQVAIVLKHPGIERALLGRGGPALSGRETRGEFVAVLAHPGVDPRSVPDHWAGDEVRDRERAMRDAAAPDVDLGGIGVQALLSIAERSYGGWVILPTAGLRGLRSKRMGIRVGRPLSADPAFTVARLPYRWQLVSLEGHDHYADVLDENDQVRARILYIAGSSYLPDQRYAFIGTP